MVFYYRGGHQEISSSSSSRSFVHMLQGDYPIEIRLTAPSFWMRVSNAPRVKGCLPWKAVPVDPLRLYPEQEKHRPALSRRDLP